MPDVDVAWSGYPAAVGSCAEGVCYSSILMRRLAHHRPPLTAKLSAVPGGQVIEALFAAQHIVALANVTDKQPLFLQLDIKGAFDTSSCKRGRLPRFTSPKLGASHFQWHATRGQQGSLNIGSCHRPVAMCLSTLGLEVNYMPRAAWCPVPPCTQRFRHLTACRS